METTQRAYVIGAAAVALLRAGGQPAGTKERWHESFKRLRELESQLESEQTRCVDALSTQKDMIFQTQRCELERRQTELALLQLREQANKLMAAIAKAEVNKSEKLDDLARLTAACSAHVPPASARLRQQFETLLPDDLAMLEEEAQRRQGILQTMRTLHAETKDTAGLSKEERHRAAAHLAQLRQQAQEWLPLWDTVPRLGEALALLLGGAQPE